MNEWDWTIWLQLFITSFTTSYFLVISYASVGV